MYLVKILFKNGLDSDLTAVSDPGAFYPTSIAYEINAEDGSKVYINPSEVVMVTVEKKG